jgi:hypothetical protein
MENEVGAQVPDQAESERLVQDVEGVSASVGRYAVRLGEDERQRALRMPEGGEEIAALVARLLVEHGVSLPGVSAADIERDLTLAARLRPLVAALARTLRLVEDGVLEAEGEAWYGTTAGYTALVRLMATNATLAAELKPALDFFGVGRTRKKPSIPPG